MPATIHADDESSITVGELLEALKGEPKETKIRFQGGLSLYRLKRRGDDLIQIEFNELVFDALKYFYEHHE
jgi:hypothetical protein